MAARIDHLVTSGTFCLDGGVWEVDNNVWIVGDDHAVIIIDPAHDPQQIVAAVGGRTTTAILLTHGHDDHIKKVLQVQQLLGEAPVYLHPAGHMLWDMVFPAAAAPAAIVDGAEFTVAGLGLRAIHTPGHSPGSTCFLLPGGASLPPGWAGAESTQHPAQAPVLFSGDTLFAGGPGATGRSYSDFPTIIESITDKLLCLPADTVVATGHGPATTIGAEKPHLAEWIARGY